MRPIDQQLIKACQNGDTRTIEKLLRRGANPHIQDDWGKNALHYAVEKQHYDIAQYLITELKLDPNIQSKFGYTPFLFATENGDFDILQLLVQYGANPHTTDHKSRSALHYAVKKRYRDIAQYLLIQLQLDPNSQDKYGITPFMIAAENGDIDILKRLIQHGADPHAIGHDGRSALHYALEYQKHDIAQYLITELKLDPNTQDRRGRTPFMIAAENGDIDILKRLIQHGADPHTTDRDGQTALHYATAPHYAFARKNHNIAQYLLTHLQVDPNSQDHNGITPLIIAAQYGDIDMIRLLIQHGANPYATDQNGRNALHYAAEWDQYETVQYLITHLHLDPNAQDHQGDTPLLIAFQKGCDDTTQTLIQLGAHPHIPNHQGETPAAIARQRRIRLPKPQPSTITL